MINYNKFISILGAFICTPLIALWTSSIDNVFHLINLNITLISLLALSLLSSYRNRLLTLIFSLILFSNYYGIDLARGGCFSCQSGLTYEIEISKLDQNSFNKEKLPERSINLYYLLFKHLHKNISISFKDDTKILNPKHIKTHYLNGVIYYKYKLRNKDIYVLIDIRKRDLLNLEG